MSDASSEGGFVWYDLITPDPDAAVGFYTELIGWGTQQWEGGAPYTMWTASDKPIGGVMALPEEAQKAGAPPHWLGYVSSPNVDASVALAESHGAKVYVPGTDIPSVGRFAVLVDPQGATIALFSPGEQAPGSDGGGGHGFMSWHELATGDLEAAWSFYSSMFGWAITEDMDMGDGALYRMYGKDGSPPMGGMFQKPQEMPVSAWMFYTDVPDVDSGADKVKDMGGQILNGPMDVPGGSRIVQCMDPQGARFAMHTLKQ